MSLLHNFPWSKENTDRRIVEARAGRLSFEDQKIIGEQLEYYRAACYRYEDFVHSVTKNIDGN
jgi:hypothetical protein